MIISQKLKNKILSISRIEDVIGDFVELKKSGSNYRGLSPFSEEKNPSFIVSPIKKIWKDFSSGKGGNIITFLMEYERFSYVESLHYLAKKYNVLIKEKKFFQKKENSIKEKLYRIQKYAKYFFISELFNKEGLKYGLNYLMNDRGFNLEIIKKFELGYASNSWMRFTKNSLKNGLKSNYLIKSGLVFSKNCKIFDRFRNRIMFPIHSLSGKIIGFGGRYLELNNSTNSSIRITKYINSPESDIFKKSKMLYGLFQAKSSILRENSCFLVEGYTDVISLHQSGIKNVVSTSGISINVNQILLIKKFTKNIILFYDGDFSGIKSSLRIINFFLEQEINLRIVFLSKGEDPDSISKKYYSSKKLKDFIKKNSHNFISFKQKVYEKYHNNDVFKKYLLIFNVLSSISKINNVLQKELYLQEISKRFNISKEILINELEKISVNPVKSINYVKCVVKQVKKNIIYTNIENELMRMIVKYGKNVIKKFNNNVTSIILNTFKFWKIRFLSKKNQEIFEKISYKYKSEENYNISLKKIVLNHYHNYDDFNNINEKGIIYNSDEITFYQYLNEILLRYKLIYIMVLIQKEIENFNNNNLSLRKIIYLTKIKNNIDKKLNGYG
ncbi:DNA primase [Blattabacterium cuenoti]|uniref:DNA primase n=1 Tax=Blattabacterium cuenoti TaxID=1653831 RepID=UPI00163CBC69|nr:DNA primase [Blattabacterium cuenoti]